MSRILFVMILAAFIGCQKPSGSTAGSSSASAGHPEGGHAEKHGDKHTLPAMSKLMVKTEGTVKSGQPTELELMIHGPGGEPIKDFLLNHEAKVHLILIRSGLDQFAHLHLTPDAATGLMKVKHTFPVGGVYHLFADHQTTGKPAATAMGQLRVAGDEPAVAPLTPNVPGTIEADGLKAKMSAEAGKPREVRIIRFELSDADGKPLDNLEPYMGARGHLVVVNAQAIEYIHAHPVEATTGAKNVVAFEAHFSQPGLYKGWGQFKRGGQVRIVPFVVKID